jgi:hypothetical protein
MFVILPGLEVKKLREKLSYRFLLLFELAIL